MRPSTFEGYRAYVRDKIVPYLGDKEIRKVTAGDVQKLYRKLKKEGGAAGGPLAGATVRRIHGVLHQAMDVAVDRHLIVKNPTKDVTLPKKESTPRTILNDAQLERFMEAIKQDRQWHDFFYLEITTGLRRGELLALLWTDLDVEKRTISITKQVTRTKGDLVVSQPKTHNSIRVLPVSQQAVELLVEEHKKHPGNPYMFPSPKTGGMFDPDSFRHTHEKILKSIGAEHIRFHDLRHTFATMALQNGVDVKTVSSMLGHYSAGFTLDTYAHVTTDAQLKAAQTMGNILSRAV